MWVIIINNLITQLSDRSKIIFNSAHTLAVKDNKILSSYHILFIILDDADLYIKNILIKLNLNINLIKKQIGLLLKQSGPLGQNEQVDHSVITLLKTSERLMKEFGDKVITIEVL